MTLVLFSEPWGFVENSRDEHGLLEHFRRGLELWGFTARSVLVRDYLLKVPSIRAWLLPNTSHTTGIGYLMSEADREIKIREAEKHVDKNKVKHDFLQR